MKGAVMGKFGWVVWVELHEQSGSKEATGDLSKLLPHWL